MHLKDTPALPVRIKRMSQPVGSIVRGRGHTILVILVTAVATGLVIAATGLAWRFYSEWRLGRIELTTEGDSVVCQVLDATSDSAVGEPYDLVTRAVVALPDGDYRLRVNGTGRLGRTYRFAVNRGETQTHTVSLDEGRLLRGERAPDEKGATSALELPIPFVTMTTAVELTPGKSDLIEWIGGPLICRDGFTGKPRWQLQAPQTADLVGPGGARARWMKHLLAGHQASRPIEPAPDLDGDGTRDLVWAFRRTAAILALSGKDGSMLWNFVAESDGSGGPRPEIPVQKNPPGLITARDFADDPVVADLGADGVPDLVATIIFSEIRNAIDKEPAATAKSPAPGAAWLHRRVVVAVSGRSGRLLWASRAEGMIPDSRGEGWRQPAVLVRGERSGLVACVDGTKWRGLDPATGRLKAGPIDLGFISARPVQYADLDGDREPEILELAPGKPSLHAWSLKTGRELWVQNVDQPIDQAMRGVPLPSYPLTADLDGDGRFEVVIADTGILPPATGYRGITLLDGATGAARWRRPLRPENKVSDGLAEILTAPDLDGDGTRDLIAVALFEGKKSLTPFVASPEEPRRIYVDALSGKDGRSLWWWKVDAPFRGVRRLWRPHWFGRGPDGWPLLAVPLGGANSPDSGSSFPWDDEFNDAPIVHLLEATTGIERHTVSGLAQASFADLDGDGLTDLWGEVRGELRAFRGEAPEAWRALGKFLAAGPQVTGRPVVREPAVDLNGDGTADTLIAMVHAPGNLNTGRVETTGSHTAVARSGRDGHVIWKTELDPRERWFEPESGASYDFFALPLPDGDLDGDGTADVVFKKEMPWGWNPSRRHTATLPVQALSGRTGKRIWSAGPLPLDFAAHGYSQVIRVEACAPERDGPRDLLVWHRSPFHAPGSEPFPGPASDGRPSLARISGQSGRVLWDAAIADYIGADLYSHAPPTLFRDLDRDGSLGALFVLPALAGPTHTLLVISLATGKIRWSKPFSSEYLLGGDVVVSDLNGDGELEVAAIDRLKAAVHVYDGRDGKDRWTWTSGISSRSNLPGKWIALADFEGKGRKNLCVQVIEPGGKVHVVVLDGNGEERNRRTFAEDSPDALEAADCNGDGRDELLVWYGDALHALDGELHELWSWRSRPATIDRILPGSHGRAGAVILAPALALSGATGVPIWTGQAPLVEQPPQFLPGLLDSGANHQRPLLIGQGLGATVCRVALPTSADGKTGPATGTHVRAGRVPSDPRWSRPLPWVVRLKGFLGPMAMLVSAGLALINFGLPITIFLLATHRRRFTVGALMTLPIAAAIPLVSFLTLSPWLPVGSSRAFATELQVFLDGTLAGLPIFWCAFWMIASLVRRRSKPIAIVAGLTLVASFAAAAIWVVIDRKSMAEIEHYDLDGWYLAALPGAYAATLLCLVVQASSTIYKLLRPRRRR